MRRLVGEVVRSADDKRLTENQLLEMLGLESIQSLIRKRKLQWVAHCARMGDKDLTSKCITGEGSMHHMRGSMHHRRGVYVSQGGIEFHKLQS